MKGVGYVIRSAQVMLRRLGDHRTGMLNESEKVIITPGIGKVSAYADKLKEAISHLQIP